ncbi:MAG: hypothetical protein ABIA75_01615 [Candidatus Neomarinimicrobiota bacterium]
MSKRFTGIIILLQLLGGLVRADVVKEPIRFVMLSGEFEQYWRLIISAVNDVDAQYDIYPRVWIDTVETEFKIRLKSKIPLQFVGDRTRFEGGIDSLRIEVVNQDEETLLIEGDLKRLTQIVSHRLSNRNFFVFDIYTGKINIGEIAGDREILFSQKIWGSSDSLHIAQMSQLADDLRQEGLAVNVSQEVRNEMLMQALLYSSVAFGVFLIIVLNVIIIKALRSRKRKKTEGKKTGADSKEREKQVRAIMAAEKISYDEAELKLNVKKV